MDSAATMAVCNLFKVDLRSYREKNEEWSVCSSYIYRWHPRQMMTMTGTHLNKPSPVQPYATAHRVSFNQSRYITCCTSSLTECRSRAQRGCVPVTGHPHILLDDARITFSVRYQIKTRACSWPAGYGRLFLTWLSLGHVYVGRGLLACCQRRQQYRSSVLRPQGYCQQTQ